MSERVTDDGPSAGAAAPSSQAPPRFRMEVGSAKPWLLDLFCGAGGCTKGYQRAGFYVVGVDIKPQPNYCGDDFMQSDALKWLKTWGAVGFDAIHASPPCQNDTAYNRRPDHVAPVPALIPRVRELLQATGLPYMIENVRGAPLIDPVQICGTGLGLDVERHRLFETNFPMMGVGCAHGQNAARFPQATNRTNPRRTVEVGVWRIPLPVQQKAMGIDWMTLEELSQAIPPAYTEHIGGYLLSEVERRAEGGRVTHALPPLGGLGRRVAPGGAA